MWKQRAKDPAGVRNETQTKGKNATHFLNMLYGFLFEFLFCKKSKLSLNVLLNFF